MKVIKIDGKWLTSDLFQVNYTQDKNNSNSNNTDEWNTITNILRLASKHRGVYSIEFVRSCFGTGAWLENKPWLETDGWKE